MRLRLFHTSLLIVFFARVTCGADGDRANRLEFFEKRIRPVLVKHCYKCHSARADKVEGGLLLDTRDGIRRGGESGPAVIPEEPDDSPLLQALRYDGYEMPPDSKLPDRVVADFERWIREGAVDPRDGASVTLETPAIDFDEARRFWSFQRPIRHHPPDVPATDRIRQPVDAFVIRMLEQQQLKPAPDADARTLARRLSFDLVGLPPGLGDVEAMSAGSAPDAFEKASDRILASPHFGERWTRLWLDIARYAEDQAHIVGNNKALFYPNAWRYRDWVIDSLNRDMPFDRFVRLQLAADLIEPDNSTDTVALGFMGLGPKYYRRNELPVMCDEWEDRVDTLSRGLLGLTVACARCHDHKYDPIETEDYYGLAGVFASTEMYNRPFPGKETGKNGQAKSPDESLHVVRDMAPKNLTVFIRGDVNAKGPVVERRYLRVMCDGEPIAFQSGSGRAELAEVIVSRDNPLTARVFVNRVWAQLTGHGLVRTPSNFGTLGERPTHPDLLDTLAVDFMDGGWSLKSLVRRIVHSATYRQSSEPGADAARSDPDNRWLSHMNRRRHSVEAYRDAILISSGRLDDAIGGPSIDPGDPAQRRRTIYSQVSRFELNKLLALFDFPDPNVHSARRTETTTSLQKLFVMNSPFMVEHAGTLANLIQATPPDADTSSRISALYRQVFSRPPTDAELTLGSQFIDSAGNSTAGWQQYAHVLLASNELLFLD